MTYSPFFDVLYDQKTPVGEFLRGTHYSVLRAAVWQDCALKPLKRAQLLDFAVIWDEDHDERVIEVIERMYFGGLLSPVLFIGERKGCLSIILDADIECCSEAARLRFRNAVKDLGPVDDPWPVESCLSLDYLDQDT